MHELSIALGIVEAASEEAVRQNASRVCAVHLKLGPLSGVVKEALEFAYEASCFGTLLAGSRLIIEDQPVIVYCGACRAQRTLASIQRFVCPECGAATPRVISGRELELAALEVED
jgi:hydrogenase nickel incorporation protein HypA/HybF